jgi:pilus assembly protein Flp/PilA
MSHRAVSTTKIFNSLADGPELAKHIFTDNRKRIEQMTSITNLVLKLKVWKDTHGQDLIEYALMAGFVAVAAGAIMPNVATSISTIFSQINSVMTSASTQS